MDYETTNIGHNLITRCDFCREKCEAYDPDLIDDTDYPAEGL